jgi:hypothetical protein
MIRISFTQGRYLAQPTDDSARAWLASYVAQRTLIQRTADGVLIDARFVGDLIDAAKMDGLSVERI